MCETRGNVVVGKSNMVKRGTHSHECAVVSPTSGKPSACQACATLHSSKPGKSGQAPVAAWSYADGMGKQMRSVKAGTKRKADWVVLCESCKARIRRAEKQPRREATAVTVDNDADDLALLLEIGSQIGVTDDEEELLASAATAAAQTHSVPLVSAATVRTSTPEPPSSEKRAPTSEARRGLQLEARIAELTSENVGLHATITELTSENVGLNATNSELTAVNSELARENVGLNATISKLQGQLTSTRTASYAELEKRLEEYEKTTHGV